MTDVVKKSELSFMQPDIIPLIHHDSVTIIMFTEQSHAKQLIYNAKEH